MLAFEWTEYFNDTLTYEEMVAKPLEDPKWAEIHFWGFTAKFWNTFEPKVRLDEKARRPTNSPAVVCDESGELIELETNWFEANEVALKWFARMKKPESLIDRLEAEYEGLENQLVRWLRERNWRPLIRRLWIEWLSSDEGQLILNRKDNDIIAAEMSDVFVENFENKERI